MVNDEDYINELTASFPKNTKVISISAETGVGLEELLDKIDKIFFKKKRNETGKF